MWQWEIVCPAEAAPALIPMLKAETVSRGCKVRHRRGADSLRAEGVKGEGENHFLSLFPI